MSECIPGPRPLIRWTPAWATVRAGAGRVGAADPQRVEEAAWIRAARGGDANAFRHLVERYRDRSFETALRIVRRREDAEEATQDAFVRAWRALPDFREDARFSTWLYRIVTRRALDAVDAAKRRTAREVPVEPGTLDQHALPADAGLPDTSLRRLDAALGGLDALPRAVVTLFYLRDRSVREIAGILDLPDGTVKTHLHRSRAALRAAWKRSDELPRL